jgi:undecaprenyl-diphosphatase
MRDIMTVFESFILGLVQGLSEFLPISSSGHLALLQHYFGIDGDRVLTFTVLLHLGTLIAVFIAYRQIIWGLIKELCLFIAEIFTGKGFHLKKNNTRKLGVMIIIASVPAAIVGLLFDDYVEAAFTSIIGIGACLMITGALLFVAEQISSGKRDLSKANFRNSFVIGLFQAIALLPGISRSGSTIVGGLLLGFTRELAVTFAFLISIPTVLGAVVLEIPDVIEQGFTGDLLAPSIVGVFMAAVAGFAAIKIMIKLVTGKKLYIFSIYTWVIGVVVIIIELAHPLA